MKNKWLGIRVFISVCLAVGWWDFWYPELADAAGVYNVVYEESAIQTPEEMIEYGLDEYTYYDLMKTDRDDIRFRFRLWEIIEEYMNKG